MKGNGTVQREDAFDDEPAVLVVAGECDAGDTELLEQVLAAVRAGDGRVVIDMIDATFADSSVVRALVAGYQEATEKGGWLRLAYTHHMIGRIIEICGLEELLPQYPSVQAAVNGHVHSDHAGTAADRGR
ncbi:MAG: STAS domain-containing protein [Sporichthyaceae bacterium]|jgi:anti-anti-sigma factor